uniref:CWF19-like protein 2 n=1 Tax=Styela clava TaxID=7725 RepID=UPI00193A99E5|nr:CWF19-like protein 2 [Styela clava]
MASFVSSRDLDAKRAEKRKARHTLLEEEKSKFLAKERALERHKESGNDKWMLPGIQERLDKDASKLGSHEKKHKKHKKKKKKKKVSSESEDSEDCWEENSASAVIPSSKPTENLLNFDEILSGDQMYTSKSMKEKRKQEKEEESLKNKEEELIGQHPKELNPYWKEGGEGLPPEKMEKLSKNTSNKISKDWLLKSLKRMNEQAEEQGRTVQSIAAERYGSWAEFQNLLREAEPQNKREKDRQKGSHNKSEKGAFMKPHDGDNEYDHRRSRDHHHRHDKERYHRSERDYRPKEKGDKNQRPSWKKPKPDSERNFSEDHQPSWKKKKTDSKHLSEKESSPLLKSESKDIILKDNSKHEHVKTKLSSPLSRNIDTVKSSDREQHIVKEKPPVARVVILSEKEKNALAAKILKAELMGNDNLANKLKLKLEKARQAESDTKKSSDTSKKLPAANSGSSSDSSDDETVVLTRTGKDGQSWPVQHSDMAYDSVSNKKRKKKKVPTHRDGERERYFADDDRHSLKDLVRREKMEEAEDQDAMFSRLASKQFRGTDSDDFTLDDMYVSQASQQTTRTEEEAKQRQKAISDHKKLSKRLENCRLCFGNPELPKHLLIAIGKNSYLCLPEHKPLSQGHCFIVPMHHCTTGTGLDEDVWEEIKHFMRTLQIVLKAQELDCVFMQTCMGLKKSRHFYIDCIPMPIEEGEMAPIYFKKAIQESESEWSHNKKLIDTRGKDARKCIPKGLPYFSVDFGLDGGFAHVVEDEVLFPHFFGREVVGGMLDVEPRLWRHPPKDHFTEQTKRSIQFSEWWKPYDWTANVSSTS